MRAEILRHVDHDIDAPDEPDDMFYYWGSVRSWRPLRRIVGAAYVDVMILRFGAVAAEITYSEHRRGRGSPMGPVVDALFNNIDAWFDRFRTWLEVSVDQDLDPDHPIGSTKIRGEAYIFSRAMVACCRFPHRRCPLLYFLAALLRA
jgi:hypothetical protein